jgi:hypothetical protein
MVIGQHHPDGHLRVNPQGIVTRTRTPVASGPAAKAPPNSMARSGIDGRPTRAAHGPSDAPPLSRMSSPMLSGAARRATLAPVAGLCRTASAFRMGVPAGAEFTETAQAIGFGGASYALVRMRDDEFALPAEQVPAE